MIQEWAADLLTLSDLDWCRYAFNRDPLVGRISPAQQEEFSRNAMECGLRLAQDLFSEYGDLSPEALARQLGLNLSFRSGENSAGTTLFATFEEPDSITINAGNAEATDQLILEEGLEPVTGAIKTAQLLIAHELYHYLELSRPNIYTAQKLITLWKIGPLVNLSRIPCLEEIGAMAFARELVGLKCSAYLFDVLMLYPQNPQRARETYDQFIRFGSRREETK